MSNEKTFQELKAELDEVLLWFESDEIELEKNILDGKKLLWTEKGLINKIDYCVYVKKMDNWQ